MVWFLCFHGHVHCPKPKKAVEPSAETKHNTVEGCSQNKDLKFSNKTMSSNQLLPRTHEDTHSNISTEKVRSSYSLEHCWESEEMNCNPRPEGNTVVHLGSELDKEDRISGCIEIEREIYQEFLVDASHDNSGVMEPLDSKNVGMNSVNQCQEALSYESLQLNSDAMHEEAIFSIGDSKQLGREFNEDFYVSLCGDHDAKSGDHALHTPRLIAKSYSLPNIEATPLVDIQPRCRSAGDLCALDAKSKEFVKNEARVIVNQGRVNFVSNNGEEKCGNHVDDDFDLYSYVGLAKDWIIPRTDEVGMVNNFQEEPSVQQWDEIQRREFKIKRIEEWVSDLQHTSSWEETDEASYSGDQIKRGSTALDGISSAKLSAKIIPGMEAAKNYISSLTVTSTSAQLANHGLVVIPFLSAFASLRAINLSGNAIVRITAGALPRGLHMLNLSKNSISTIEGLRELTRLRILDLSYNRIFRIGHGLASCSSLKELYLAGNKISEVEGLHRLLKLNVLDLRFNKISTAKCLGQLAANYSSLQAISLEGNPAQRHVGDEQLKKYLQGLLPHLAYFNRNPTKVSSLKDTTDRTARSGVNMQQFDRSLRSEHKPTRKVNHSGGTHKYSVSSVHGRTQATGSPKRSRGRQGHLPPSGTRGTTHKYNHHHYPDIENKVSRFQLDLSMRRSRSEGSLGAS